MSVLWSSDVAFQLAMDGLSTATALLPFFDRHIVAFSLNLVYLLALSTVKLPQLNSNHDGRLNSVGSS